MTALPSVRAGTRIGFVLLALLLALASFGPAGPASAQAQVDADGDGYPVDVDCDDGDPSVNPGAHEACDGRDTDCDGWVDEGCEETCLCAEALESCLLTVNPRKPVSRCFSNLAKCSYSCEPKGACLLQCETGVANAIEEWCEAIFPEGDTNREVCLAQADARDCPSVCSSVPSGTCGDSHVEPPEECDDTNIFDGDGCDSCCLIEPNYVCTGWPSVCQIQCTIEGTEGKDRLYGTPGDDVICGFGGNDKLFGFRGNDTLLGGGGNDRLYGGLGHDELIGEAGNDRLYGWFGNDTISGGDGDDKLWGYFGNDALDGGNDNDLCVTGRGIDTAVNCER